MSDLLTIIAKITPELTAELKIRLEFLTALSHLAPAGRRTISQYLGCSERAIRNSVQTLRQAGLIAVSPLGMELTDYGHKVLGESNRLFESLMSKQSLANRLQKRLNLKQVVIVSGDTAIQRAAKDELGRAAAQLVLQTLQNGQTLSIGGGTTLSAMVQNIPSQSGFADVTVVPTRGGLGEYIQIQANTIAAQLAQKLGSTFHPLYAAENLSSLAINLLSKEPQIKKVLQLSKDADICVHGIGEALEMAKRRGSDEAFLSQLRQKQTKAEVFGYYLDAKGKIVHAVPSIGLHIDDLLNMDNVIAVAGGSTKAEAIAAVLKLGFVTHLVTDEITAKELGKRPQHEVAAKELGKSHQDG